MLAEWLATRPSPPSLEVEAMLRLLYADQGSTQDLLSAVRATRAWALARAPRDWPRSAATSPTAARSRAAPPKRALRPLLPRPVRAVGPLGRDFQLTARIQELSQPPAPDGRRAGRCGLLSRGAAAVAH